MHLLPAASVPPRSDRDKLNASNRYIGAPKPGVPEESARGTDGAGLLAQGQARLAHKGPARGAGGEDEEVLGREEEAGRVDGEGLQAGRECEDHGGEQAVPQTFASSDAATDSNRRATSGDTESNRSGRGYYLCCEVVQNSGHFGERLPGLSRRHSQSDSEVKAHHPIVQAQ